MNTKHQRAKPLPPAQRKQAIVDAVIPLLLDRGSAVTSRQMAEAAGIAEGTIFRVFPDKSSVIMEAIKSTMDPAPTCDALAQIPASAPLESQLEAAAAILLERSGRAADLMGVLRIAHASQSSRSTGIRAFIHKSNSDTLAAVTALLERHADSLRFPPHRAAIALRGLIFANAHPMMAPTEQTTPEQIVDLFLNGVRAARDERSV